MGMGLKNHTRGIDKIHKDFELDQTRWSLHF